MLHQQAGYILADSPCHTQSRVIAIPGRTIHSRQRRLQSLYVELLLHHQLLQPPVLFLKLLQTTHLLATTVRETWAHRQDHQPSVRQIIRPAAKERWE